MPPELAEESEPLRPAWRLARGGGGGSAAGTASGAVLLSGKRGRRGERRSKTGLEGGLACAGSLVETRRVFNADASADRRRRLALPNESVRFEAVTRVSAAFVTGIALVVACATQRVGRTNLPDGSYKLECASDRSPTASAISPKTSARTTATTLFRERKSSAATASSRSTAWSSRARPSCAAGRRARSSATSPRPQRRARSARSAVEPLLSRGLLRRVSARERARARRRAATTARASAPCDCGGVQASRRVRCQPATPAAAHARRRRLRTAARRKSRGSFGALGLEGVACGAAARARGCERPARRSGAAFGAARSGRRRVAGVASPTSPASPVEEACVERRLAKPTGETTGLGCAEVRQVMRQIHAQVSGAHRAAGSGTVRRGRLELARSLRLLVGRERDAFARGRLRERRATPCGARRRRGTRVVTPLARLAARSSA